MARIRFDISAALARWHARKAVSSHRFRMMDLQALDERARGPGWFDSSWDLDHGLDVEIAAPGDPSFLAWIEAQTRAMAPAALQAAATEPSPLPPGTLPPLEGALEFEQVDWRAWAPSNADIDLLPQAQPASLEAPALSFELVGFEAEPARELALL